MPKAAKIYLVIFILMLIFFSVSDGYKPDPVDWTPYYSTDQKSPLGLYVLDHEWKNILPAQEIISVDKTPYQYILDDFYGNHQYEEGMFTYVFIDHTLNIDDKSVEYLLDFVHEGNTVLMSSYDFPTMLMDTLSFETHYQFVPSIEVKNNSFKNPRIATPIILDYANKALDNNHYKLTNVAEMFLFDELDSLQTTVLGYQKHKEKKGINFIKITYGAGTFLLHTQPSVFTNHFLLDANNTAYTENLLKYVPDQPIIFDNRKVKKNNSIQHPLRYIMSQKSLKWAWVLSLTAILLYILLGGKRRQRIIPILKKPTNTSIDFAITIGDMYFHEGKPSDIIRKKITYFLEYIRNKYLLDTQNLNDDFIRKLQAKSGADPTDIKRLIQYIIKLETTSELKENHVVVLNTLLDKFHKKTAT